jgi:hypothetical protein
VFHFYESKIALQTDGRQVIRRIQFSVTKMLYYDKKIGRKKLIILKTPNEDRRKSATFEIFDFCQMIGRLV